MKANNKKEANEEARRLAKMLKGLFLVRADSSFPLVSSFAQYFAIDVLGYRDAEIANSWTQGFIAVFMDTPTADELSEQYTQGTISLEEFSSLIRRAIEAPEKK